MIGTTRAHAHRSRAVLAHVAAILMVLGSTVPPARAAGVPYLGTALRDTTLVRRLQDLIQAVDGPAKARAESLTGLSLDRDRLNLILIDVPIGRTQFHAFMSATGHDTVTVSVQAQAWLRSGVVDSLAALRTLTHEYIHAVLRQRMRPDDYKRLPGWYREGLATYLSGEHADRLWVTLGQHWQDPTALYVGLADGPPLDERVGGSWWFSALHQRYGPGGIQSSLAALVAGKGLMDALAPFGCTLEDVWRAALELAAVEVQDLTHERGDLLRKCMEMRSEDRSRCRKCFGDLIKRHAGTYAAEFSLYLGSEGRL